MRTVLVAAVLAVFTLSVQAQCPPSGETAASLQAHKSRGWKGGKLDDAASRNALALGLLDCLRSPDPLLRDELAFDGLQTMMRAGQVEPPAMQQMRVRLLAELAQPDASGFGQPFSALVLAEVVRADRMRPFLFPAEREEIVERASAWLAGVRDYRGFDAKEGWRHGVAHGADLMVQLAVHPLLQRAQAETMLGAIASQAVPPGEHFYRYGEGERLMAPVFYLARRGWFSAEDWERWLASVVGRVPQVESPTQASLAARHNASAFLQALYVSVMESGNEDVMRALMPGLKQAIKTLG
ncbi:DUF2785 domain-containing protein [Caenimonas aquaedulcis]|uniref:DUF2785 domain-containing protein n=1 Tax=Caenimonas aquaedulcis TaxID=2793270 RepID=A0A931MHJ6_9BURK|nr:DUF2785 domain-containing protein [Caenimonas aquaedulcis]MBG9389012.1 DUF2785 domain-containing protein [Caenimonas aquaedulcis]